jgi:hypothetical protein
MDLATQIISTNPFYLISFLADIRYSTPYYHIVIIIIFLINIIGILLLLKIAFRKGIKEIYNYLNNNLEENHLILVSWESHKPLKVEEEGDALLLVN